MAVILDTDHWSILLDRTQPECDRLAARLDRLPPADISLTIVTVQEQFQGWVAYINRTRPPPDVVQGYGRMLAMLRAVCRASIREFDQAAQDRFRQLRTTKARLATMDLRIACIALVTGSTLLSRNLRDFRQVPGLTVEDWAQ